MTISQMNDWKAKIGLIFVSIVVCLIFAELIIRVYAIWHPLPRPPADGQRMGYPNNPGIFSKYADHVLMSSWKGFRKLSDEDKKDGITNVRLEYNSMGIRGPEIGRKIGARVLLLGDSLLESDELPFEDTMGAVLNKHTLSHGIEVIQQGFTSWSPVTEFAWFFHFGKVLDVDRIYLFLFDNDFLSDCAYYYSDEHYRKQFVFDKKGIPCFMPRLKPNFFLDKSYLIRYIKFNVIDSIQPKWKQVLRLYQENIPVSQKNARLIGRIFQSKPIYPLPDCPTNFTEPTPLFKQYIVEGKFIWCNRMFVEMVMLRLPVSEWDEVLQRGVKATIKSITDFYRYLQEQGIELFVVYAPAGFDIDRKEHDIDNSFRDGYAFLSTGSQGLEDYLTVELGKVGISVINLKQPLLKYKKKNCPGCENFLYFKYDGHWKASAHRIIADVLERHLKENPIRLRYASEVH